MRNARFWEYVNGEWIKITVKPGQSLAWSQGGPNEEGWNMEGFRFRYIDDAIRADYWSDGRDCDGRMSDSSSFTCPISRLQVRKPNVFGGEVYGPEDGSLLPAWDKLDSQHRDYSAEAAGY